DALVALSQALNDRVRCAAIAMRGGGNRSGADSVLVAQTGYPFAVDFARGFPRYDPHGSSVDNADVSLVVGDHASIPPAALRSLERSRCIVTGPRATESSLGSASIRIDTGVDGIHAAGTGVRADDVPLPLRASVPGRITMSDVLASLANLLRRPRP
ncbi:MAG TPA: hypothetical protein VM076_02215, partial [Gemmatimonadaceae bacterium]|nr:hypothetical protein [Gemmatimonadaceae bacterium]